jgi:hypothetical protein
MSLPKKTRVWNWDYLSLISINGREKDCSPNGLGDEFQDLWYNDLVQAQAIKPSFLLESNTGFDASVSFLSLLLIEMITKRLSRLLGHLLEQGLFEPEQGEGQMWGQRNSKYTTAIGIQLLAKIHVLDNKISTVSQQQNHSINHLEEHLDFIGETSDRVGRVVDELNSQIDTQEIQIEQLANMVNNLVGKTKGQAKEIKLLKANREEHHKVINTITAKVIALEQYTEDIQKKVFPQVGGGEHLGSMDYH